VQWLTAGRGIQHAEMFPLVHDRADNPLELFQIWLNLPSTHKMVESHFSMSWDGGIPRHLVRDGRGRTTFVRLVAGRIGDLGSATGSDESLRSSATPYRAVTVAGCAGR
jgi:redox-sensitive bicupin YhaK (pirin superfamily)